MVRERLFSKMIGMPVVVDDHMRPLSTVKDLIIDPLNGDLQGFLVDYHRNLVVSMMDVLAVDSMIHIASEDDIINGNDVVRIESILNSGCYFVKNKVFTVDDVYLGKVYDLALEVNSMKVRTLYVAKDFLGLLQYDQRIIGIENIVEVLPEKIVVKNDVAAVKDKEDEMALEDAFSV